MAVDPARAIVDTKSAVLITLAVCVWEVGSSLMYGPLAAQFCEMFRGSVRYSGASVGYQLVTILAGGCRRLVRSHRRRMPRPTGVRHGHHRQTRRSDTKTLGDDAVLEWHVRAAALEFAHDEAGW